MKRLCSNDNRTPGFLRSMAPAASLDIFEETWICDEQRKSVLKNGYLKDKFSITIRTRHLADAGTTENAHQLSPGELNKVERVTIDIAGSPTLGSCDYNQDSDPTKFVSSKTGRGKLGPNWVVEAVHNNNAFKLDGSEFGTMPVMCCYVLVDVEVKIFGLQTKLEKNIQSQTKRLLLENFSQIFCSIDSWHGLTLADINNIDINDDEGKVMETGAKSKR